MVQIKKNLPEDINSLQVKINEYCAAWTTQQAQPNWLTIEKIYANEDLLHYDAVTPHSFANVSEMKEAFAQMKQNLHLKSLELKPRKDLNVFRRGDLVWTTILQDVIAVTLKQQQHDHCTATCRDMSTVGVSIYLRSLLRVTL